MRKKLVVLLLLLVVGFFGCNRRPSDIARPEVGAAEYEVLSAWLDTALGHQKTEHPIKRIVIVDQTQSDDDRPNLDGNGQAIPWKDTASLLIEKAPSLQQTTIAAFREVNLQQAPLHRSFQSPLDYEIVSSAQLDSLFRKGGGGWDAYYKQYPDSQGILKFSRVGFTADGTQALFYYSNNCGGLCGGGSYVVMEKRGGSWVVGGEIQMWIS